jgi:class 3 adenylate cyclase/tetratricopeptide (TPR) repeat protein
MESFNVYIPTDRRIALSLGQSLPDQTEGAVLFADVSGFTPLTEMLVQKFGPQRGAEEMTFHLNHVYEAIIGKVDLYRGSVISFSGDAITCWFDGDNGQRALTCALAMQKAMLPFKEVQTAAGVVASFSIKASVTAGSARRFLVGNPRVRSIEALAGKMLDRVGNGEKIARQGEVVAGSEVIQNLHAKEHVVEWRTGRDGERFAVVAALKITAPEAPWENIPDIPAEQSRDWLLPAIYERLAQGGEHFLAELRPVVALFLKFTGINYDDENASELLDAYIRWVQSVVAHYEGDLLELVIGDKGSNLYVTFGALQAHEDDAARAAGAALDLLNMPAELSFIRPPQIGLSLGLMRTGSYGSRTRRSYAAQGPQVNVASRLMSKAEPGQILVAEAVAEAARKKYQFEFLDAVPLKGVSQPIPVYVLRGQAHGQNVAAVLYKHAQTTIFGRQKERDNLAQQLDTLRNGRQSSLTFIEGEAGIGKSRLVAELVDLAESGGTPCWIGAGDAVERSTPYLAWRPVFTRFFELEGLSQKSRAEEIELARQQVMSRIDTMDPTLAPLVPLLNVVLPFQYDDNEVTAQLSGEVRANQTQNLCVTLFKHATAQSPHVLVIEDAHWLDSASWILLSLLSSAVPSLMTVISMRPAHEPVQPELARLLAHPNVQRLALDAMPAAEIQTLICHRLGVATLPSEMSRFIHERAEGNPFFSEELAYAMRDTGLITIVNGECRLAPDAGDLRYLDFPDTIDGVILSRIGTLPAQEQLLLKVASVVGRIFALRTLREIHPVETDRMQLPDYLSHLHSLDITPLETPEPDLAYIFRHIITQEVAYNLLLFQQRRDLHRLVAEWYERSYGEDLSPFYPLLGYHWRVAEDAGKQIKYLELAGEQAVRNGAYREAIGFFQELIALNETAKLVQDPVRVAHWERQLGEAFFSTGEFGQSMHYHQVSVKRLGRPFAPSGSGLMLQLLGEAFRQVLHRLFPAHFVGTVTDPHLVERYLEGARAYERISHIVYFENNTFGTVAAGIASLNLSERAPASPELVRAYGTTEVTTGLMGLHKAALSYEGLARRTSETVHGRPGSLAAEGWRLMMAGTYHSGAGSLQTAIEAMNAALKIWEQLGEKQRWKETLSLVSTMNVYHGDLKTAYRQAGQLHETAIQERNEQFRFWALIEKAMVLELEGRLEEARAALEDALSNGLRVAPVDQIWHGGVLASVLLHLNQFEQAVMEAEKVATVIAASQPTAFYVLNSYSAVTEVFLAGMEQDAARRDDYRKRALTSLNKLKAFTLPFPVAVPRLHLLRARYHAQTGKTAAVLPALRKGLAEAERLGLPADRARAHLDLSGWLTDEMERKKHEEAAKAVLAETGAAYESKRPVPP